MFSPWVLLSIPLYKQNYILTLSVTVTALLQEELCSHLECCYLRLNKESTPINTRLRLLYQLHTLRKHILYTDFPNSLHFKLFLLQYLFSSDIYSVINRYGLCRPDLPYSKGLLCYYRYTIIHT